MAFLLASDYLEHDPSDVPCDVQADTDQEQAGGPSQPPLVAGRNQPVLHPIHAVTNQQQGQARSQSIDKHQCRAIKQIALHGDQRQDPQQNRRGAGRDGQREQQAGAERGDLVFEFLIRDASISSPSSPGEVLARSR